MAIQKINLGSEPLGEGGDTNRSANTKINENFSNTDHAASRLVGTGDSDLVQGSDVSKVFYATIEGGLSTNGNTDLSTVPRGVYSGGWRGNPYSPKDETLGVQTSDTVGVIEIPYPYSNSETNRRMWAYGNSGDVYYFKVNSGRKWAKLYSTENTTKEEGTGYLVASSPVLKVQHDSFEKVHEAEQLDIDVKSIKTGVYEITGTTGLREGDGWNLKPPKDVNGNVLCICEASESNGVITLKTYKKKFDFETVSIVADYEQPTDIPEGAVVMLRFNDLPQETVGEDYSV